MSAIKLDNLFHLPVRLFIEVLKSIDNNSINRTEADGFQNNGSNNLIAQMTHSSVLVVIV